MALHEQSIGKTDEWYTPLYIFESLDATFDMDVAHPGEGFAEWVPAKRKISKADDEVEWSGFIWMNPPFGGRNGLVPWLKRFEDNGNGIALLPDRTSAPWWQNHARIVDAILFVSPKIKFIGRDGLPGQSPAQGTTLTAIGSRGVTALLQAEYNGLGVFMRRHK